MGAFFVKLAKLALGLLPARPAPDYLPIAQITESSAINRAMGEFEDERAGGFLKFFALEAIPSGQLMLDLGCGFGGRTVQFQRILGGHMIGLEIDPRMAAPALRFARSMGAAEVSFVVGAGEALPFKDNSLDAILSYDVLEHVLDPEACLRECQRALKPGGLLLLVFPPYFHPLGAHLEGYVSRLPCAHWIFPPKVLLGAIDQILSERGDGFRPQPLRPSDKLYGLNGLTIRRFEEILQALSLEAIYMKYLPLLSPMNRKYESWKMRYYAWAFSLLPRVPILRECFTHRVVAILRKSLTGFEALL
jgi:SAM-dependent methyltransferase